MFYNVAKSFSGGRFFYNYRVQLPRETSQQSKITIFNTGVSECQWRRQIVLNGAKKVYQPGLREKGFEARFICVL